MENRKALVIAFVFILILVIPILFTFYFWIPQQERSDFENYYLGIMENLNAEENKTMVRNWFERDYMFGELIEWVNDVIVFDKTYNDSGRHWKTDPASIKENGKGQCGEFGILCASACLANGYETRLVVAVDVSNPNNWKDLHVWDEVKMCGWIHVDPSGNVCGEKYRYETLDWGENIGSTVRIYAFEEGKCEEVTANYLS